MHPVRRFAGTCISLNLLTWTQGKKKLEVPLKPSVNGELLLLKVIPTGMGTTNEPST